MCLIQGTDQTCFSTRSIYLSGDCNCNGFWRRGREHDNLSRWIGSFVIAVLCGLLNKVFCCPDKKLAMGEEKERQRQEGWRDGWKTDGPAERQRGCGKDRRGPLVSGDNGGQERERVWDERRSIFPWEAAALAVADWSRAGLYALKGTNNRLSNGIVPLRIVCAQVRSLGVLTHQVSIGLNLHRQ